VALDAGQFLDMAVSLHHIRVALLALHASVDVQLVVERKVRVTCMSPRASKWQTGQCLSFWSFDL
jgi:hypothetical protein